MTASRNAAFAQRAHGRFSDGPGGVRPVRRRAVGRTLQTLYAIDTGLAVDHVAVVELSLPDRKFDSGERVAAMYESLLPRIKALPGVTSVATVNVVPFTGATSWLGRRLRCRGADLAVTGVQFNFAVVGAEYFETMGIRPLRGRTFDRNDRRGSAPVAMVSEQAARLLGVENGAVGRRIRFARVAGRLADHRRCCTRNEVPRDP